MVPGFISTMCAPGKSREICANAASRGRYTSVEKREKRGGEKPGLTPGQSLGLGKARLCICTEERVRTGRNHSKQSERTASKKNKERRHSNTAVCLTCSGSQHYQDRNREHPNHKSQKHRGPECSFQSPQLGVALHICSRDLSSSQLREGQARDKVLVRVFD
jgi:hypothetical protein